MYTIARKMLLSLVLVQHREKGIFQYIRNQRKCKVNFLKKKEDIFFWKNVLIVNTSFKKRYLNNDCLNLDKNTRGKQSTSEIPAR